MTTTITPAMTPKQKQVYELLGKGVTPPEIAKRLKISTSGVYGHMRNMRAAGVQLANTETETPAVPVPPPAVAESNGAVDPKVALETAIVQGNDRARAIEGQVAELHSQIEALGTEKTQVEERVAKFTTALGALA